MVIYRYSRNYVKDERHFETLEEAMRSAYLDYETGEAHPVEIEHDGRTYDNEKMMEYWKDKEWLD